MRGIFRAAAAAAILLATAATALAQTKLVETFSDWAFYSHDSSPTRICFAVSAPQTSEPAGARRDRIYFYVSAWPREGVRSEVSVKIGYPFRKGSEAMITIGTEAFKLFTHEERAFVDDPIEELKLIEAMKKGATMVVQGMSERGTATKDTFSLAGVSKAVQTLTTECN
ncbi:MAG: hypothetical protein KJZ80_07840 [Hyphomicrobiaceae bacterium]|nr:hypothetical protein [Hyphomicrobiaceae bacterium]